MMRPAPTPPPPIRIRNIKASGRTDARDVDEKLDLSFQLCVGTGVAVDPG